MRGLLPSANRAPVAAFLMIGAIGVDVERTRRPLRRFARDHDLLDAFEAREVEHGLEQNALQLAHSKQHDSAAAGYKLLGGLVCAAPTSTLRQNGGLHAISQVLRERQSIGSDCQASNWLVPRTRRLHLLPLVLLGCVSYIACK
jgi:hypothetical protein